MVLWDGAEIDFTGSFFMNKSYHFIGIGGIGMGGLASLVLAQGHRVTGSDVRQNALTLKLIEEGAMVYIGHDATHLSQPDYVVVSSAISRENPEFARALATGIPVLHRAELLAQLTSGFKLISVAGAHGKTTTSSLVAHVLQEVGLRPAAAVGGIVNSLGSNSQWGEGRYFVIEADESDGSFLNYHPDYSILTNVDEEHMDFYRDFDHILSVYQKFVQQTRPGGRLIAFGDDPNLRQVLTSAREPVLTYGWDGGNDLSVRDIVSSGFRTTFFCDYHERVLGPFEFSVPGEHNILNAMAVILLAMEIGIDLSSLQKAVASYQGVRRRFQQVGSEQGILIVDDYAHHPTEIQATLKGARSFTDRRKVVVFQPHRYSRFQSLYKDFLTCWYPEDELIVTDIYSAGEKPMSGVSMQKFVVDLKREQGINAMYFSKADIVGFLKDFCKDGDLLLTLGAGDVTEVGYQLRDQLQLKAVG